jgi:hypothetical protein
MSNSHLPHLSCYDAFSLSPGPPWSQYVIEKEGTFGTFGAPYGAWFHEVTIVRQVNDR